MENKQGTASHKNTEPIRSILFTEENKLEE